jgi:hypothetical protein
MAVNPNLATLMRVIEEYQDKIPEGEYLEAMNALGALHRVATSAAAAAVQPIVPIVQPIVQAVVPVVPVVPVPVVQAVVQGPMHLYGDNIYRIFTLLGGKNGYDAWNRACRMIPGLAQMLPEEWVAMSQEERNDLNRLATRKIAEKHERTYRNPAPSSCPFIARHALGDWSETQTWADTWTCVCGYSGKLKNWKKHEKSARHQDWARLRIVPEKTVKTMRQQIEKDERGSLIQFIHPLSGGFRYYPVRQERNEWTHPELYPETLRLNNGQEGWFVYPRDACEIMEE